MLNRFATFIFLTVSLSAGTLTQIDTGGVTYGLAEKNIILVIQESIAQNKSKFSKKIDNEIKQANVKMKEHYKPENLRETISPAKEHKVYYPDSTYTLKDNIVDADGKVLYPKGYQFNPLHYITLPNRYVFFDFTKKEQVTWIKKNKIDKDITTMLIITDGNVFKATDYFKKGVFYANDPLLDRFNIQGTPSIAAQQGDRIRVEMFYISPNK